MPLTVNVGLNRKASKDFQSAGVSINLAAELDMGLLADPPRLQHEIEKVYMQAEAALDKQVQAMSVTGTTPRRPELPQGVQHGHGGGDLPDIHARKQDRKDAVTVTAEVQTGGGQDSSPLDRHRHHSNSRENMNGSVQQTVRGGSFGGAVRPATESQLRALRAICKRSRLDLEHEAHEEFGVESLDQLDVRQASQLIDILKERQGQANPQRRWA